MDYIIQELTSLGIPSESALLQLKLLKRGTKYMRLSRSAAIGDGILDLTADKVSSAIATYEAREAKVKVLKFVPASGAASRMFKDLREFLDSGEASDATRYFFAGLDKIAFSELLKVNSEPREIAHQILSPDDLAMADRPKGSIPFHRYPDGARTAFEEHLVEGVSYATTAQQVHIHFTLAPEHMRVVTHDMERWSKRYAELLGVDYDLQFSIQEARTDTICVDSEGQPIRKGDGSLLLRPGGHGALIHNLNALDADIIFIKNIDNVVTDSQREDTITYKKALGGLLIEARIEAREHIKSLKKNGSRDKAIAFLKKMGTAVAADTGSKKLIQLMNRPYRVCGMVKNEGEPGGGPFWVKDGEGENLQIVESAQIDLAQGAFREMLDKGTHFNPVDLVCCLNDLYGERKNLLEFVDMDAAFVTEKMVAGQNAKVLEWPGLWNGAMAHWNSLFVQVPISTFNPVKTVNDLLRPMHQGGV